jgi:hypothetical protein
MLNTIQYTARIMKMQICAIVLMWTLVPPYGCSTTQRRDYTNYRVYKVDNVTSMDMMYMFDQWAARKPNDVRWPVVTADHFTAFQLDIFRTASLYDPSIDILVSPTYAPHFERQLNNMCIQMQRRMGEYREGRRCPIRWKITVERNSVPTRFPFGNCCYPVADVHDSQCKHSKIH